MTEQTNNDKQALAALKLHADKIITAIVVVLAVFFGWQYYQNNYAKIDTVAADLYTTIADRNDRLVQSEQNPSLDETTKKQMAEEEVKLFADIDALVQKHGDTAYAWQALMIKASHQSNHGNLKAAIDTLKQAKQIKPDEGLAAITNLRLAQAVLSDGDIDAAYGLINEEMPKAFEASRQEILGDIYVAKNDIDKAKQAYQAAWELLRERHENRAVLALKLQSLGLVVQEIEPKEIVVQPSAQTQNPQDSNQ